MRLLITERNDISTLLGMDWLKKIKLKNGNTWLDENSQSEKRRIITKFPVFFQKQNKHRRRRNYHTTDTGILPGKTKCKTDSAAAPGSSRKRMREIDKFKTPGESETSRWNLSCFTGSNNRKNDKLVKTALDSMKLNGMTVVLKFDKYGELLDQISVEITNDRTKELMMSKIDLDYAHGQMRLSAETRWQCVFAISGRNFSGYYLLKKRFYSLATSPQYYKKKLTKHYNIVHRQGWTIH